MHLPTMSIWRLVQDCAEELTKSGYTPFTRSDLIKCVQSKRPNCAENSINPIIQGLTDNLRGGAPGAVGKNILHSVGRGKFVLSQRRDADQASAAIETRTAPTRRRRTHPQLDLARERMKIGGHRFSKICDIQLIKDDAGEPQELFPQDRYANESNLPLNRYGSGPFCKFKIPNSLNAPGVYAIIVDNEVKYIGECQNLSARYNMGYGNISPRNCFVGGQETNCRINNLILSAGKSAEEVSLWFYQTENYKNVEMELRASLNLEWNRA